MELLVLPVLMMMGLAHVFAHVDEDAADESDADRAGTEGRTESYGDGNDRVFGSARDDIFDLGDGSDRARMGAGDDTVQAGAGDDAVMGGEGDDRIALGAGDDRSFVTGPDGAAPAPEGFAGDDRIFGGAGDDLLVDYLGADGLFGGSGDDTLDGRDQSGRAMEADRLDGGSGADTLYGDAGDRMSGGAGQDRFAVILDASPEAPAVITDYEPGEELVVSVPLFFEDSDADLVPVEGGLELRLGDSVLLVLEGVDDPGSVALRVTAADVAEQSRSGAQVLLGSDGDDRLTGGAGDDAIFAGRGADVIAAGGGDDYVSLRSARPFEAEGALGWGRNIVEAGAGRDQILGGQGDDTIYGGAGGDLVLGGGGSDVLSGGAGADRIDALDRDGGQADVVSGGAGDDRISADDGDIVTGGGGADTIIAEVYRDGDAAVRVTDFNPRTDRLEIVVAEGDPAVRLARIDDGTRVLVGDRAVFDLAGVTPQQLRDVPIRVTST